MSSTTRSTPSSKPATISTARKQELSALIIKCAQSIKGLSAADRAFLGAQFNYLPGVRSGVVKLPAGFGKVTMAGAPASKPATKPATKRNGSKPASSKAGNGSKRTATRRPTPASVAHAVKRTAPAQSSTAPAQS